MTPQTLLGTASTTKAFTALTLAQIVHGERSPKDATTAPNEKRSSKQPAITWQTPVSTLLPGEFVLPTRELTEAVTIEDILCHRTGVPSCDNACLSWGGTFMFYYCVVCPPAFPINHSVFPSFNLLTHSRGRKNPDDTPSWYLRRHAR